MVSEIAVSNESKYISLIQTAKGIYNGTVSLQRLSPEGRCRCLRRQASHNRKEFRFR